MRKKRHSILIRAPAELVLETAESFDLESIGIVRGLFWLRAKLLASKASPTRRMRGLVEEMKSIGWGELAREPGRLVIMGGATQPWVADVKFTTIPADGFVTYSAPDEVKIAWTLDAEPLGPDLTRFSTETRIAPTDESARRKFQWYWRRFGLGIGLVRLVLLPPLRREAERRAAS